ncbi:MAG: matrixin family metalloprotease, partial [Acidobacteriota bacterium]
MQRPRASADEQNMNWRTGAVALMMGGALFAQDIHLKARTLKGAYQPEERTAVRHASGDTDTASVHKIIQFDHAPGVEDIDSLLRDGIPVVGALPDNAVVVSAPGGHLPPRPGVRWIGRIQAADKVSPEMAFLVTPAPDLVTFMAIVEFYPDISPAQQETVAGFEGLTLQRPAVLRSDHAIVTATAAQFRALTSHDEVAYIFPADPALLTDTGLIPCAGMLTISGMIGQYANIVHGWDLDSDHAAHLGYAFGSITPKVPASTVKSEVVRALTEWSRYTNVIFQPAANSSSPRTVLVKFVSGYHGDAWPFDGPGGILAHTFYPVPVNTESLAGDMHLDADENWHAGGDIDIYSVALHEAGHPIGLSHSDKPGDVMYPYYRSRASLSANDIGAAQTLYGLPTGSPEPVTISTGDPSPPIGPVALSLVLDTLPATSQTASIALTGTLSGGKAPYSVQWQTDHGYSGKAPIQSYG